MEASGPLFSLWRIIWGRTATMTLSVPGVDADHITQICATHLQSLKRKTTSASTVAAKVTLQKSAPADQMITGRNQGQHQGTSRTTEWVVQSSKNCTFNINRDSHHQTRFDKRYNRQYLPNYNNFQQSPLGSIPGQGLSATLLELANIQSRSLEMMAASQTSQQEAFHQLTKASKDKANDAMLASIKNLWW